MRFNWKSIGALLVSAVGVLSSPALLAALPEKAAAVVTAAGILLQAFAHPVTAKRE